MAGQMTTTACGARDGGGDGGDSGMGDWRGVGGGAFSS